jgi:innexin
VLALDRRRFIRNHARLSAGETCVDRDSERDNIDRFTDDYLRIDGVFLLRLIAHNTNGITTTDITRALYNHWSEDAELTHIADSEDCKLKD